MEGPLAARPPLVASEACPGARLAQKRTILKPVRADAANTEPTGPPNRKWLRRTWLAPPHPEANEAPAARRELPAAPLGPFCDADLNILIPTANDLAKRRALARPVEAEGRNELERLVRQHLAWCPGNLFVEFSSPHKQRLLRKE